VQTKTKKDSELKCAIKKLKKDSELKCAIKKLEKDSEQKLKSAIKNWKKDSETTQKLKKTLNCETKMLKKIAVSVDRTRDLQIFSLTLSQLSYPRFDVYS
jgi:hypothetical protein